MYISGLTNLRIGIISIFIFQMIYMGMAFMNKFGLSENPDDVHFYLYPSPSNPNYREEIQYNNKTSLLQSSFQKGKKTVFLVHGFWSNSSTHFPADVKNAYLEHIPSQNYIVVDWKSLATSPWMGAEKLYFLIYIEVMKNIPIVSQRVADFIYFLENNNYTNPEQIHMVGHSMGAHISGLAGKLLQDGYYTDKKKVARITGLDPAGPLFDLIRFQRKLNKEDAQFVDAYHTSMGPRGDVTVDGHADFYPNGGYRQPSCEDFLYFDQPFGLGSCSHQFVVDIFAASISKRYLACQCEPFIHFLFSHECVGTCERKALAGEPCPNTARGQYYFVTTSTP